LVQRLWRSAKYDGRRGTKRLSRRIRELTHASLARVSQCPCKRVCSEPCSSLLTETGIGVGAVFIEMLLFTS
jgi:hypothetical protein